MVKRAAEEDLDYVLEQQRSEFMAVKTIESDSDYAYKLQMEEALNASASVHLCTSQPTPPETVLLPCDDGFDYVSLLLEDIGRFDMERKDREQSELLMRQMKEDLDLRIHDQEFSKYIMGISEQEWGKYGDNYERPYEFENVGSSSSGVGDSSSETLLNKEVFRLYCKGLVSEERIKDMTVAVAGVGCAICDSRDDVVLEVRKNLDCDAGRLSNEAAEILALVEGLRAALDLDLKVVNIVCDNYMVHQHITGRQQPKQSIIAASVNEVVRLQTQFNCCTVSFVERNGVKFAFKLARDAIVSQISWSAESSKGKSSKETCSICFEDVFLNQIFAVNGCFHRYCFSCMKQHVEVKLLNGMPADCPHANCNVEVSIESCEEFLDPKLVAIMSQRKKEATIPVTEKVYCPNSKCSALMSKIEVLEYTKPYFAGAEKSRARKCLKCQQFFCLDCKVPWHYNMTCQVFKSSNVKSEDAMLNNLAKQKLWRQCVKCNHMVELAWGCYHISCRCGHEFCYTCGAEWKDKKATCHCPVWDERNIIRDRRRR